MRLLAFEDHGELVAAQARQGAALVQAVFQALRHGADQQVADAVAEAVVDVLEVVQIDAQQRAAAAFTFGAGQRCSMRSRSSRRLGRPVSGSWWARKSSSCWERLRLLRSENTAT